MLIKAIETVGNEIRVRIRDDDEFRDDTFRRISIDEEEGIDAIAGKLKANAGKENDPMVIQSFRFDKSKWTEVDAAKWVREHGYTSKTFALIEQKLSGEFGAVEYKSLPFEIKIKDEEKGIIWGYASTVDVDRVGDRVFPKSFAKSIDRINKLKTFPKLFYAHRHKEELPVGTTTKIWIDENGLGFEGKLSRATQRAREVWEQVKEGIQDTFSIGYQLLDRAFNDFGGVDFKEAELLEISFAPVPTQLNASLAGFKKLNLQKEESHMSGINLADDKTFQEFSSSVNQFLKESLEVQKKTDEGMKALTEMVEKKEVAFTAEEKDKLDKVLEAIKIADDKFGTWTKDLAERFPKRDMEFPVKPQPVFTGEKAYQSLIETPVKFFDDDHIARKAKEFQRLHDVVLIANSILYQKYEEKRKRFPNIRFVPLWEAVKQNYPAEQEKDGWTALQKMVGDWNRMGDELTGGELSKVLTPSAAGAGLEWIPTGFSAELFDQVRAALVLAGRFRQIAAPTDPYKWPVRGTIPYGVGVAPSTDYPSSLDTGKTAIGTANVTFAHSKMRMRDGVDAENIEDSIVAAIPAVNEALAIGASKTLERAIINGQKTGTHQDNDVAGVSEATKGFRLGITGCPLWNGLRFLCLNPESGTTAKQDAGGTGAFSLVDLWDGMSLNGVYALPSQLNNLVHVMGISAYFLAMKFAELATVEKFGPFATVVNGVLTKVFGADVIPSGEFPVNLAATGVNTLAGPNNTTGWLIVNTLAFAVSYRRGFTLEAVRLAQQDMFDILGFLRVDFEHWYPSSNGKFGVSGTTGVVDPPASYIYNIIK